MPDRFQSLRGFQPFWSQHSQLSVSSSKMFQSLRGFQPFWSKEGGIVERYDSEFQSLRGFQPFWSPAIKPSYIGIREVSIPERVSAVLERDDISCRIYPHKFQSLRGFQPFWSKHP